MKKLQLMQKVKELISLPYWIFTFITSIQYCSGVVANAIKQETEIKYMKIIKIKKE